MFLILSSLTILATVTIFRALSGLWDVCMTTEEVAALSLQMLGDFPTICLCARFMLVIVRQGKVSGVYVWTALVAVAWIFLAKIESGNMKCFLENLFTGMEVHTLVGVLFFLFSLPFYIAFAFTLKDLFGRRTRAALPVFLISAILWSAAGCRTMGSTSRSHSRLKTCSVAEHGLCSLSLRYSGVPQGAGQWTVRRVWC